MDQDESDNWALENRDHRATVERDVTVYCQSGHDTGVKMRPVEGAGIEGVIECPECGTVVRVE